MDYCTRSWANFQSFQRFCKPVAYCAHATVGKAPQKTFALLFTYEMWLQNFAVVTCAIPGLSVTGNLGWATFQVHTYRARKLVINKTFVQSRSLFPQLWPVLFQGWVCFTPLLFRFCNSGCAQFQAQTYGLDRSYSKRHSCTCFCSCKLRFCRAKCV